MITWGINALNHGSSLAAFKNHELVFYKECRLDELEKSIMHHALDCGGPDTVYWYEDPYLKKLRQLRAGQWSRVFETDVLPRRYLDKIGIRYANLKYTRHHASHAAAGYYTCPFDDCAVVVLDAIGEFECASIWHGNQGELTKVWSQTYPNSLGLFYSAFTDLLDFTPVAEEHLLQDLSLSGDPARYHNDVRNYFNGVVSLKYNLHKGVRNWPHEIVNQQDRKDIAAAVQLVFEEQISLVMRMAQALVPTRNLVYMGGCAMNSKANQQLPHQWDRIWSLPNPGDASSSVGAVLYHTKRSIPWNIGVAKHIAISV